MQHYGERRGIYRGLVGKPKAQRPRRRWKDNIKMDHYEVEFRGTDWIELVQGRQVALVNAVMNFRVP
jgi:hypothetical protein